MLFQYSSNYHVARTHTCMHVGPGFSVQSRRPRVNHGWNVHVRNMGIQCAPSPLSSFLAANSPQSASRSNRVHDSGVSDEHGQKDTGREWAGLCTTNGDAEGIGLDPSDTNDSPPSFERHASPLSHQAARNEIRLSEAICRPVGRGRGGSAR